MKYYVYSSNTETDFRELKDPITFLNKLREDKPTLQQAQDKHKAFSRYLRNIRKVSKSVFNAWSNLFKFLNHYISMVLETWNRSVKGEKLKILTLKMLQIFPIATEQKEKVINLKNRWMKFVEYILCFEKTKLLKKYIDTE